MCPGLFSLSKVRLIFLVFKPNHLSLQKRALLLAPETEGRGLCLASPACFKPEHSFSQGGQTICPSLISLPFMNYKLRPGWLGVSFLSLSDIIKSLLTQALLASPGALFRMPSPLDKVPASLPSDSPPSCQLFPTLLRSC